MKWLVFFFTMFLTYVYCSTNGCIAKENTCSGFGIWGYDGKAKCNCTNDFWGDFCQFGRRRYTEREGVIADSEHFYHCMSKYMYLIDTQRSDIPIKINLDYFRTECNWDHLYIFDGKSIYDPLVASLSGIIQHDSGGNSSESIMSVTTHSGAAYLYFFSDLNINEGGFNISYSMSTCRSSYCNNHGFCASNKTCTCDVGWTGTYCSLQLCSLDIYDIFTNKRNSDFHQCDNTAKVSARSSHKAVMSNDNMWLYGGFTFDIKDNKDKMRKLHYYNFKSNSWKEAAEPIFSPRYGHSMVSYGQKLIIFGGKEYDSSISSNAWQYQINTNSWSSIASKSHLEVFGHAAVVVGSSMLVFFGFNKQLILTNAVQKLNLDSMEWSIVDTTGAKLKGRFGHSANYDRQTDIVFVFGGYIVRHLTADLLLFHVSESKWSVGIASTVPKMLHSGILVGRNLVIFGGNTYNGSESTAKCHSSEVNVYNFDCKSWSTVNSNQLLESQNRYGQSAVYYNSSVYVFGGFDGQLKNDFFQISIKGDPSKLTNMESCLSAPPLAGYVWIKGTSRCVIADISLPESDVIKKACGDVVDKCYKQTTCPTCTDMGCTWLIKDRVCKKIANVSSEGEFKVSSSKCVDYPYHLCSLHSSCYSCSSDTNCHWLFDHKLCSYSTNPDTSVVSCYGTPNITSCEGHDTCNGCLHGDKSQCMWCDSLHQCVNSNSYTINYLYGQCYEWISGTHDMCEAVNCSSQSTCRKCFQQPGCGWCSDGNNTGLGECMDGKDEQPLNKTCPVNQWYFTQCPGCFCNGHSGCINGTDTCEQCYGHVTGQHCETCLPGYYGNPENNGTCSECFCNDHYRSCDGNSGQCECNLKGATGDQCQICDMTGNYVGNATNGGLCYFVMTVDYQYRSNLTKVTTAAFSAKPKSLDQQLKFQIVHASGASGYMNLSLYYSNGYSKILAENYRIGAYRVTIEKDDYEYTDEDVELRFIVYGWKNNEHFAFTATLTHPPPVFDLVYFLIMFLVCFCGLLILLIIIWKVKHRYDTYRRNINAKYELKERISRPCKSIKIRLRNKTTDIFQKVTPTLIASEDFATGHVGVGTFFIEYPRGEGGVPPPGMSGLALGSTLITNANRRTFSQTHHKFNNGTSKRRTKQQRITEVHL